MTFGQWWERKGWCGSAVTFDLTEDEAKSLAKKMNEEDEG